MAWLDPPECVAARDSLERGNPAEAARLLLACRHPQHRAVRELLLEASRRLVEVAEEQFQAGQLEAAEASIQLAARCAAVEARAGALREQIAQALLQKRQHEAWLAQQLDQAQQLADAGRLHSALDVLAPLREHAPAARLRVGVEQRLARFRRHVEACRECLAAGQAQAAHRHWQKARQIMPEDPQLAELATGIARSTSAASPAPGQAVAVRDRGQRLVLDKLVLVVSAGEVCLGTSRAEGVHVPIQGPLHGRHAVFLRDGEGWQLAACRDRHGQPCHVLVNGRRVQSLCRLADGDRVQLGSPLCTWRFRLPVAGSATAVLQPAAGSPPSVWTPAGNLLSWVALVDEELMLRANHPAHIVLPTLPCKQLLLRWHQGYLHWHVEGGLARLELPGRTVEQLDSRVYLPGRLVIEPDLDEAERLGRAAAGFEPAERLVLELGDPSSVTDAIA